MKRELIKSVVVLTVICLVTAAVLAVVNYFTADIIHRNQDDAELAALSVVMPDNNGFEIRTYNLPGGTTVKNVYREKSGKGYVFLMELNGYQPGLQIMCGINTNGEITGVKTLECNDTAGYGLHVKDDWYMEQYKGKKSDLAGIKDVSGATITSTAYRRAIDDAFTAFVIYSRIPEGVEK